MHKKLKLNFDERPIEGNNLKGTTPPFIRQVKEKKIS